MKINRIIKVLPAILLLLIISNSIFSQVVVEKSKDKVIISGVQYYIHQVKKGETAYSISKVYAITVEELVRENPPAVYGVNEGQALRIPVKSLTVEKPADQTASKKQRDETKFIYHNLKPGETVYFLSKSYGVSENEIITSNPGIDINKLPVGAEIVVPRRNFMSDRQKFDNQEKKYTFHKVLKGESMSSIAESYGLTVRELRKVNRDMRFPQVGDFLRIPVQENEEQAAAEIIIPDTAAVAVEDSLIIKERPAGFTAVKDLKGSLDVAVLLPFYIRENSQRTEIDSSKISKGKKQYKITRRSEAWIYPRSLDFIEMYEGILLAADTLRSLGINLNLHTFDIKSDTVAITNLINSGKLAKMNLIIGPVYSNNLTKVANYARDLNIPVVSPVPLLNNSALTANPTLFLASSSLEIAQESISKKVSEYSNNNIVFIHSDTTGNDTEVKRFKNLIFKELAFKIPYDEIKFKEMVFYSRSMFDNDSINRLSHALSGQTDNIVVIASEDPPVISETIQDLHNLTRKFNVKVLGYPIIRELDNLDPKYLFDMNMLLYSSNWIDYSKDNVKQFNSDFRQKYLTEPSEKSYAWQGYDIAYYFISGISIHGKEFLLHPEIHYPDLLQTEYNFIRKSSGDGFENNMLFNIRYTKDFEVKLEESNDPLRLK
jgi:LysM repeat protein